MGDKITRHYQPRGSKDKLITSKEKTSGAAAVISKFLSTSESDDPETIIDIKITNPLKRIYELIQEIKKHQTTTFNLKFTIPLIALPIFLFAAFKIGQGQGACRQFYKSKTGLVRVLSIDVPQESKDRITFLSSLLSFIPSFEPTTYYIEESRTILIDNNGNTTTILHPKYINFSLLDNKKVIITGEYSSCASVLSVVSEKNVMEL